jgi:phenylacetate-CoA ligase
MHRQQAFYRSQWDEAGLDWKAITRIEDIHQFPFTRKNDLRDTYPFGLLAVPENELNRIHASSGSTGKPTVVGYTKGDLSIFAEVVARSLCCAGAEPGMKLHNAYGYGLFTGGLGLHAGAELLGMAVVPVSGGMTDRQILLLRDFQSEVICCTPSYALTLADEIQRRKLSLNDFNLKYAILGAEPWTETVRQEVEAKLGVVATNIYGLSEIIGPGVSQEDYEERNGSHIWEDHFYPEIVHPETGEVLPEGESGVLVLTTLTKTAMPLMRYWTNDICSLFYDADSKRTHIKMSAIQGRHDDMLIIRGVNLFHTQVEAVLQEVDGFSTNYQLIVFRKDRMDAVEVRVELDEKIYQQKGARIQSLIEQDEALQNLQKELHHRLKQNIGLSMRVSLADWDTVPRSQGGKLKRIVDQRN